MESLGATSIMEITEFDVSLGQLVTRTLSAEEEAEIIAIQNAGLKIISYSIEDSYEDKVASVKAQYMEWGHSEEDAEAFAIGFVK